MRQHATFFAYPRCAPRRCRFAIPNKVWEYQLRPAEFLLLSFLCFYQSPSLDTDTIAKGIHMAANTVKKYLVSLKSKGLVTDDLLPTLQISDGKYFFTLPNEIFLLALPPSAFLVYAYLLLVENRRMHQCHSSIRTIAAAHTWL